MLCSDPCLDEQTHATAGRTKRPTRTQLSEKAPRGAGWYRWAGRRSAFVHPRAPARKDDEGRWAREDAGRITHHVILCPPRRCRTETLGVPPARTGLRARDRKRDGEEEESKRVGNCAGASRGSADKYTHTSPSLRLLASVLRPLATSFTVTEPVARTGMKFLPKCHVQRSTFCYHPTDETRNTMMQ